MERVSLLLPSILEAFSHKVGYNAPGQLHRDVMVFVHKNRKLVCRSPPPTYCPFISSYVLTPVAAFSAIAGFFQKRCTGQKNSPALTPAFDSDQIPSEELVSMWRAGLEQAEEDIPPQEGSTEDENGLADDRVENPYFDQMRTLDMYRELIFDSTAYQWLLESLHKSSILTPTKPLSMEDLTSDIMRTLSEPREVRRRKPAKSFKVIFEMEWDPIKFFEDQRFNRPIHEAFGKSITLTGSVELVQALPCDAYMVQTWPSTGISILELVRNSICDFSDSTQAGLFPPSCDLAGVISDNHLAVLPDGTSVNVFFLDMLFIVEVTGPAASIAEVAEQMAWLAASLRSSPSNRGVAYCSPRVSDIRVGDAPLSNSFDAHFRIDFAVRVLPETDSQSNGQCWHGLFRNPVVVEGYPILKRPPGRLGLEIPLGMMASLVEACRVNTFRETLVIKGFSAMLVLTQHMGDLLIWHLLYRECGARISYPTDSFTPARDVSTYQLKTARHVVGWCADARSHVGKTYPTAWH